MTSRNARFASRRDVKDLRSPAYGVFLGYHGFPARPLLSDQPGHALVVAPTRAGKGVGLLMQNALCWSGGLIVLDPKGEFREKTLHFRAQYQQCYTWGPTTFAARWNPLAEIAAARAAGRDPMEEAMRLARAFSASAVSSSHGDNFWNTEATSFLAHALLWGAIAPAEPATLAHVYDLLCRPSDLNQLHRSLERIRSGPLLRSRSRRGRQGA